MKSNIRGKLKKILFGVVVTACVIFAFALFIQNNNRRATTISVESLKDATSQSAQRIDEILDRAQKEILLTADLYEEMNKKPEVEAADLCTLTEKSPFDYIEFTDSDGINLNAQGDTKDMSGRYYYKDGMAGNNGIDIVFSTETSDENLVVFYAPLHYEGKIIGVLTGIYKESQMSEILSSTFFGENARTFLCMRDGTIIASCSIGTVSESIFDKETFNHDLDADILAELKSALSHGESYEFHYAGTKGQGNAYVTALTNSEWMLVQTFPSQVTTRFIKQANKAGMQLLASLITIFAVCIIVIEAAGYIQKKRLILQNREKAYVTDGMARMFKVFVHVDFEQGAYQYLAGTKPRYSDFPLAGDYEAFEKYIAGLVEEADEAELKELLRPEAIQKNMDDTTDCLRYEYRVRGSRENWDSINIICLKRVNSIPTEVLIAYQDVTKVKEREQRSYDALKEAYQAVESANQAKSSFLSNMSHDIRTPMNAIMGMTAIAAMNIENKERVTDCLNKITISSQHLLGLINEVLDMSKIESGKMILVEEEFSLSDVIDRMVSIFLPQTEAKKQQFKVNITDIAHEEVIGDSMRLQQIFVNILGNAVKFTPEGGMIDLKIRETASRMRGYGCYIFEIEDNGIGMEDGFLDHIFEPFVRADNSQTGKVEGTGLGMPIVKNIVQMMNGDIQVESKLNEGSKFTVTVYLKLNHSKHDDVKELENLTVLVADDEQDACESACCILNEIGMVADWVLSGAEAVERVLKAHSECKDYSVIILDWKMPEMNGLETAKRIRQKVGSEIPIIILSAFDYSAIEQEAREAGVNAFISKPMFRSRLIYVMKSLMLGEEMKDKELDELQTRDYTGKRILLVEDNALNMEIGEELLKRVGVMVEKAVDGREAVDKVNAMPEEYYDLIFMDIQMPVMNGYEAAKQIRASKREDLRKIPIVAMSADAFADDVAHAREVGMNEHISKPVEISKLLKILDDWIA